MEKGSECTRERQTENNKSKHDVSYGGGGEHGGWTVKGQELSCCEWGLRVVECNTLLPLAIFSKVSFACLRAVQMDSQGKALSVNND